MSNLDRLSMSTNPPLTLHHGRASRQHPPRYCRANTRNAPLSCVTVFSTRLHSARGACVRLIPQSSLSWCVDISGHHSDELENTAEAVRSHTLARPNFERWTSAGTPRTTNFRQWSRRSQAVKQHFVLHSRSCRQHQRPARITEC